MSKLDQVEIFVLGRYPRSARFRKVLRDFDDGKLSDIEYVRTLQEELAYLCGVQIGAGLSIVQDPAPDEHDIFRPYVESWRGVYYDGLLRFFDNNFFYRIPVFVEKPDIQKYYISRRAKILREIIGGDIPIKISIPGPVTFAFLSRTQLDRTELVFDIARLLAMDVARAVEIAGLNYIQIDEPFLFDVDAEPRHVDLVRDYLAEFRKVGVKILLAVYYNMPRPEILEKMLDLPVDMLCLDVLSNAEKVLNTIKQRKPTVDLALSVINGREIMVEDYEIVKKLVEKVIEIAGKDAVRGITTTCGFELIPLKYAVQKTIVLGRYGYRLVSEVLS